MMENDLLKLREKLSELTDENKRYVIAVAEALFFTQGNGEVKKCDMESMTCQRGVGSCR